MKKKLFSFLVVAMLAGSTQLFAWGIGLQGGGGPLNGGLAVTFALDQVPLIFAVNLDFWPSFTLGATADYWIMKPNIMEWDWGAWNWYWGVGAMVGGTFGDAWGGFTVAPRILAGMNLEFLKGKADWLDHLEVFLQVAWQPTFHFGKKGTGDWDSDGKWEYDKGVKFWWYCFPFNLGARMWF